MAKRTKQAQGGFSGALARMQLQFWWLYLVAGVVLFGIEIMLHGNYRLMPYVPFVLMCAFLSGHNYHANVMKKGRQSGFFEDSDEKGRSAGERDASEKD